VGVGGGGGRRRGVGVVRESGDVVRGAGSKGGGPPEWLGFKKEGRVAQHQKKKTVPELTIDLNP